MRRPEGRFLVSQVDVRKERGEMSPKQRATGLAKCQRQERKTTVLEEGRKREE